MRPFARAPHVELPEWLLEETDKVAHRDYSTGFYYPEHKVTQNTDRSAYFRSWLVVGEVLSWSADEDGRVTLMSRNKIEAPGQTGRNFPAAWRETIGLYRAGNRPARCRWRASTRHQ